MWETITGLMGMPARLLRLITGHDETLLWVVTTVLIGAGTALALWAVDRLGRHIGDRLFDRATEVGGELPHRTPGRHRRPLAGDDTDTDGTSWEWGEDYEDGDPADPDPFPGEWRPVAHPDHGRGAGRVEHRHEGAGSAAQLDELAEMARLAAEDAARAPVEQRMRELDRAAAVRAAETDRLLADLHERFTAITADLLADTLAGLRALDDLPDEELARWSARADEELAAVAASDDPTLVALRKVDETDPKLVLAWATSGAPVSVLEQTGEIRVTERDLGPDLEIAVPSLGTAAGRRRLRMKRANTARAGR